MNLTVIGYYQSLERVRAATTFALLRGFVLLVPAFLLLPRVAGISGIWLAMPLSELLTCAVIAVFYNLRRGFGLGFLDFKRLSFTDNRFVFPFFLLICRKVGIVPTKIVFLLVLFRYFIYFCMIF